MAGGQRGGGERGCAQDDLTPAGDGGEGGGTLHGVADEAEVGGGVGSEIRGQPGRWSVGAADAVVAGLGHYEDRVADGEFIVKYFVLQS